MLYISNKRECFFDDTLINQERTTAEFLLHHPIRKESVLLHDAPWEGDSCDYHNFFYDDGIYRMYYLGLSSSAPEKVVVCYAQSTDGLHWEKPELGICEYNGSAKNNIIVDSPMLFHTQIDNFMVFRDENPSCTPDKKYKAVTRVEKDGKLGLHSMYSADGIHFSYGELLTDVGLFDSLNVAFWDQHAACYRCYCRGFHEVGNAGVSDSSEDNIRDIRYMESPDFIHWTAPKMLDFGNHEDIALYTNVVQPCPGAEHILIGFPTRYRYRRDWTGNYDELCGREKRLERMKTEPRFGMVVTDCAFITSRDGFHFKRYDEAFLRPGAEHKINWVYGDCYPARGFVKTPSDIEGADDELSMFCPEGQWWDKPAQLIRYTIRYGGFVSMHSGAKEKMLVTKPFVFDGEDLYINFETSALGYLYFTLTDENGIRYESCETFGDKTDRRVAFEEDVVKKLSGKPVTLEVRMRDADLYSIMFR